MSNFPSVENLPPVVVLRRAGIKNPVDCWTDVVVHGLNLAAKYHDTTVELLEHLLGEWL